MVSSNRNRRAPTQTPFARGRGSSARYASSTTRRGSRTHSRGRSSPVSSARSIRSQTGSSRSSSVLPHGSVTRPPFSTPRLPSQAGSSTRISLTPSPSLGSQAPRQPNARQDARPEARESMFTEEEPDVVNEVILALSVNNKGTVGCAYYIALDETLHLQEDAPMAGMELVETLLLHLQPTTVIVSSRSPDNLIEFLEAGAQQLDQTRRPAISDGGLQNVYILRMASTADFKAETGKRKLLSLDIDFQTPQTMLFRTVADDEADVPLDGNGATSTMQTKLMRLSTTINLDSQLSMGCAAAVLSDIERRKAADYLPHDPDAAFAFRVRSIEMFSLADSMFVNADALIALQILGSESHPNTQMQGLDKANNGAKESLSVYGLFHYLASTPQGRTKLRRIFLRPSVDLDMIQERHRTIALLLRPDLNLLLQHLIKTLKKIVDIRKSLICLRKGVHIPSRGVSIKKGVWATLQRFAANILELREAVNQIPQGESLAVVNKVLGGIQPREIRQVGEIITHTIDFHASESSHRTAVADGVSPELDEMKRSYNGLESFLDEVVKALNREVPEWARGYVVNCIFYPQLGFLTVVTLNLETGQSNYEGEGLDGEPWERMFIIEGNIYYKNRRMRELDMELGDPYCMISDKEIEIIHELAVRVLEHEESLTVASDVCGELDCLLALAMGAAQYNLRAPDMTTDNIVDIKGGRHPLQELVVPAFIANDCHLVGGSGSEDSSAVNDEDAPVPSMMILTGPNHSGKSVYIKQIALIVYMAHIGSFVPADRATIGLTDKLLTRIATRESVSRNESAFSIDLRQAAFSINFATRRSLILIDEFGKGTNATDGAALVTALLDHFLSLDVEGPKVLAATHFHEIFENDFLKDWPRLGFAHMDVHVEPNPEEDDAPLTFLYSLLPGRITTSYGSRCAAMNGVDRAIIERADAIGLLMSRGEDLVAACCKLSEWETARLEEAENAAREFLTVDIDESDFTRRGWRGDGTRAMLRQILGGGSTASSTVLA